MCITLETYKPKIHDEKKNSFAPAVIKMWLFLSLPLTCPVCHCCWYQRCRQWPQYPLHQFHASVGAWHPESGQNACPAQRQCKCETIEWLWPQIQKTAIIIDSWNMDDQSLVACWCYLWDSGQFDMDTTPETSTQITGAGQHIAEMLIPHELPTFLLDGFFHL